MCKKEILLRLLIINTIFSFYKEDRTAVVDKLHKKTLKEIKKIKKQLFKNVKEAIAFADKLYPAWDELFEKFKGKKFLASIAVVTVWREGVPLSDKLLDRYCASEICDNAEAEKMSFIFSDVMEKKIKEIIGENNV